MEQAFVRPRVPGHRRFQELAGILIHDCVWHGGVSTRDCIAGFERLTDEYLDNWESGEGQNRNISPSIAAYTLQERFHAEN